MTEAGVPGLIEHPPEARAVYDPSQLVRTAVIPTYPLQDDGGAARVLPSILARVVVPVVVLGDPVVVDSQKFVLTPIISRLDPQPWWHPPRP